MKDAYYFSHDANARRDPKIMAMTCDFGMEGYGLYWVIVEILREQDGYKVKNDKVFVKMLMKESGLSFERIEEFMDKNVEEYKLFVVKDGMLYSESLLNRMHKVDEIKLKRQSAANKRWSNNANAKQVDAKEKKVKEKKVKEKKIKHLDFVYLTKNEYEKLVERFGEPKTLSMIERVDGYIGQSGKKYASHYHVICNWINKDKKQAETKPTGVDSNLANMIKNLDVELI